MLDAKIICTLKYFSCWKLLLARASPQFGSKGQKAKECLCRALALDQPLKEFSSWEKMSIHKWPVLLMDGRDS